MTIAAGGKHNLALKEDGSVWSWGGNMYGQLGDGSDSDRTIPVRVSGLSNIVTITEGGNHSFAFKEDGSVWSWGLNTYGQLGDGTTINRKTPVQISGLSDMVTMTITAGGEHCLALKEDGSVWSWGFNNRGQLGDGTTTNRWPPVQVSGLVDVMSIAAGSNHSFALKEDGSVWSWGFNFRGLLGDGTTAMTRATPVQVRETWTPDHLNFDLPTNEVTIPATGTSTVTVQAKAYNINNAEVVGAEITYSLASPYPGISLDSQTGILTVDSTSQPGELILVANCKQLTKEVTLFIKRNQAPIVEEPEITINANEGREYNLCVYGKEAVNFTEVTFTLAYDPTMFEVKDLYAMTRNGETTTGIIEGTGIIFTEVTPGLIRFKTDKQVPSGKMWSGILTVIRLKAIQTGSSTITIE